MNNNNFFRRAIFFFAISLVTVFCVPSLAHAQATQEYIANFDVEIVVHKDGGLSVMEVIEYVFADSTHHGIERYIPYSFKRNGSTYKTPITVDSVTDENGLIYAFESSKSSGFQYLKIGDPDKLVSAGTHTYVINYTVEHVINFFDDHDEVYWNITGSDWKVPIDSAFASVKFSDSVLTEQDVTTACYTGAYNSTDSNCSIIWDNGSSFLTTAPLEAEQGMSVVVGFPKGNVREPSLSQKILLALQAYGYLIIPIGLFFFLHFRWLKQGRDPKGRGTIVPQYEPPENMLPSVMGALWDESADTKDISATIVHLAIKGYLKIKNTGKKKYDFIRQGKARQGMGDLTDTEKKIMEAVFSSTTDTVSLDSLKNKFYKDLPGIKSAMYKSLVDNNYYVADPATAKRTYYIGAGIIGGALFFTGGFGAASAWAAGILMIVLLLIYGRIMPKKTIHGAEVKEEVQGFKWFLSVTEEERLKFHNAPEKKPEEFMEFLPYAMVLGVEKEWSAQFKDMFIEAPSWYEGQPGTAFSAIYFGSVLSSMNSSMGTTFTSHPSSAGSGGSGFGGGGFSGGGFGGGGGGSW